MLRADKLAKAAAAAQKALDRAATIQKKADELAVVVRKETIGVLKDWSMKALEDQLHTALQKFGSPHQYYSKIQEWSEE